MRALRPLLALGALAATTASAQTPTPRTPTADSTVALRAAPSGTAAVASDIGGAARPAGAAPAPSAGRTVTVPLPSGSGVFYYRAGTPGGVRIRSRRRPAAVGPGAAAAVPEGSAVTASLAQRSARAPSAGLTRLDLVLLEQELLRAIDQRLAGLSRGSGRPLFAPSEAPPVLVVPAPSPPAVSPAAPGAPPADAPPVLVPAPETPPPPAVLVEEVERAILDTGLFRTTRVHFEFGEAGLLPVTQEALQAVAAVLLRSPRVRVEVGGHTDAISSAAYNLRLSQRRAASVRDFLIGAGVDADRLAAVGYGEARPVASNETETGRALNRRVEFTVTGGPETGAEPDADAEPADGLRQLIREELERMQDVNGR